MELLDKAKDTHLFYWSILFGFGWEIGSQFAWFMMDSVKVFLGWPLG